MEIQRVVSNSGQKDMGGTGFAIRRKKRSSTARVANKMLIQSGIIIDVNQMENEESGNRMELRSGKILRPPTSGGRNPTYAPCDHHDLDGPPPDLEYMKKIGLELIEVELPANCRCGAERGISTIKTYRFKHPCMCTMLKEIHK